MRNYLKLAHPLQQKNDRYFFFEDKSPADALRALVAAQSVRREWQEEFLDEEAIELTVFKAQRFGRIPGVKEIGASSTAQTVKMSAVSPNQSPLIGLPASLKVSDVSTI
jgi:hypothetical protein